MSAIPYQIKQDDIGYHVVRPVLGGGWMWVAGPYNTRYEAEACAIRRFAGKRAA